MTDRIVFLDAAASVLAGAADPDVRVVLLDPAGDALAQIAAAVSGLRDLDAIEVVAHGGPGLVAFTGGGFALEDIGRRPDALAAIGRALALDGDLRLWSCSVGEGARGAAFAAALAEATGANVVTARGSVGPERFGAAWRLDGQSAADGAPAARPPFEAAALDAFPGVLVANKLYYVLSSVSGDGPRLMSTNFDGTGTQVVSSDFLATTISSSELVIDAAANRYYAVFYGGSDHKLISGSLTGDVAPTVVKDYVNQGGANEEVPLGLEINTANHTLSLGYYEYDPNTYDPFSGTYGLNPATQGIRNLSYNPATGTVTDNGFGITQSTANLPSDAPPGSSFTGGNPSPLFAASDLARYGTTVYFVNAAIGEGTEENALYRWDGSSGTAVRMTNTTQFPIDTTLILNPFQQNIAIPNGALNDVVVDGANNFVIFDTHDYLDGNAPNYNYATSGLWVMAADASGAAATKLNLGAGFSASHPNFLPTEMVYDAQNRLLYVTSEEANLSSGADDDNIYVFQIGGTSAGTASATFLRTITPPTLAATSNIVGLAVSANAIATLDLDASGAGTGFSTSYTENGAGVAIADTDVSIVDDDATMSSATITLTNRQAGDVLSVNGGLPAGISATAYNSATGVLTLSGSASLASYQTALHQILYSNTTDTPSAVDRSITVVINDPFGGVASAISTVGVTAVDDLPVANGDAFSTTEAATITGQNVFANNGSGVDVDVDGPALSVSAVNGVPASVGTQITLASGALLTLNANGTFAYDPNHAFDYLPAAGSGAANLTATDSFTYTLTGGGTATVTLTINGLDGDDTLFDDGGGRTLTGGIGDDRYFIRNAGDTIVEQAGAAGGNDTVYASVDFNLGTDGANVETIVGRGLNGLTLTGNGLANTIYSNDAVNALIGGDGDDRYIVHNSADTITEAAGGAGGTDMVYTDVDFDLGLHGDNVENILALGSTGLTLTGNALANTLISNTAVCTLVGGGGDDAYYVKNAADTITEQSGAGSGIDTVFTDASFDLGLHGGNVENIVAAGSAGLTLTGNDLANQITSNAAVCTLIGGAGDDRYIVQNSADMITEAAGGGFERVYAYVDFDFSLHAANAEALFARGTGDLALTGNANGNQIYGNVGDNTLTGGGGRDTFTFAAGFGHDTVTDFDTGAKTHDTLRFSTSIFATAADALAAAHDDGGGNVVIDSGNPANDVTLLNVNLASLTVSDFAVF